ncbi:response regulator transcription factor [Mycolicibacterium goodii]|uniref:winged helix-turn-helix transcriptional regulator n=1 Tax=Mycolicibacterium goodii TaxID=134601 RepID=UPI001BDBB563|nr:response regulator transcription factor [Mycolicibacterium goodii]MBU8813703.1 response regulator transcription factor [Mycolicibacterium goodii]
MAAAGRIRVLLVEPRRIYAATVARHLRADDFAVEVAYSPRAAIIGLHEGDPDVVVVCVGAQGRGTAMLDRIRQETQVGVVALSDGDIAPLLVSTGVVCVGDIAALNVRIRLALRRCGGGGEPRGGDYGDVMHRREFGDLLIDVVARRVSLRGEALSLTRTEFEILCTLAESPGEPVTCRHLQLSLWGDASDGGRSTLGVHVGNLRRKLGEDPHSPRYLRTVRGTGYCLTG